MATIDSKKLLPPSKKGGAIEKTKVLVPLKNISVKKISVGDLRPVDKETKSSENLAIVKNKIVELDALLKNSYVIDKKNAETKRKEEERKKSERREKKLEEKVKKNQVSSNLIPSIPGQSIFDRINRFIGFTLLGYLFNKYGELLPKLMEFGKILKPVAEFVESFAKNLLKGVVDFVEFGYKAYDQTRDFVKKIGGEGAQKTFDEFSKNLNILLNGAIASAMLIASTEPKKSNNLSGKGGGYGVGYAAGYAAGLASGKGIRPGAGFRDPGRYRAQGQARAGGFDLEQTRKANTFAPSGQKGPLSGISRGFRGAAAQLETGTLFKRGAGIQKALYNAPGKIKGVMPKGVGKVFGRVPIIGGLLDFAFSLAMGENPGRAAAKAVGATVGSALGTFIPIPGVGTIIGGILGDIVGGAMYDSLVGSKDKPQAKAQGGTITRGGQSSVAPSRRLKTRTKKTAPRIQPQKTQPGKDAGGKLRIEELYGKDEPGKRSALRALKKSSEDVKKMRSINGLTGSMFGAGIDMALGQKPDKKLAKSIGDVFGSVVQNAVDMELNKSFGGISKTIAMANGGVVPTREIGRQLSIGERIGKFISSALAISIESSASRIIQNLNRELNLEGGPPGSTPDAGPGGGGADGGPDVFHGMGAERMWNFFKNKGLSDFAVAGILGNARWESSFDPRARGKGMGPGGSDALGLFQWGETERWKDLVNWATSKNLDPWDFDTQLKFAWHEMQTSEKATIPALQSATSASDAAEKFRSVYERSRNTEQRRKDAAEGFYQQYIGKTYIPPTTGVALIETSQYGWRWGRMHNGIDLQNKAGWQQTTHLPVTIKKGGVVEYAGIADGNGIVTIRHDDGSKTRYIHLNNFKVRTGQTVGPGTIIGRIAGEGEPGYGNSTGPHLHFEYTTPQGKTINPKNIYNNYVALGANIVPSNKPLSQPAPAPAPKPDTRPASPAPPGGPRQDPTREPWDPSKSLKFNSRTGKWEKASLAPKPLDLASGLNVPSYEKEINNNYIIQEVIA